MEIKSNFPNTFDSENIFTVQDLLSTTLQKDYNPGDTTILVEENIDLFPSKGIITLIDQVSDLTERAISFYYNGKTQDSFQGLEIMPDSVNTFKPKKLTTVTMPIRAEHHNSIAQSIKAIQKFLGLRKTTDKMPFGPTLIGRINFLANMVHTPKAWFQADKTLGMVPFTVQFTSLSQGVDVTYEWNFGDGNTEHNEKIVSHTYNKPGIYDVALTVSNIFGTDKIQLHKLIKARIEAPQEATIHFTPQDGQMLIQSNPPILRTPTNKVVNLEVENTGELLNPLTKKPLDSIINYTWKLSDDLQHANNAKTQAIYSVGGLHDLTLRVDTQFGAYRITSYKDCIDAVETNNLWLWTSQNNIVKAFEFGLRSETFKTRKTIPLNINKNDSFLDNVPNSKKQKQEFNKNNGLAPIGNQPSGAHGSCLLFWASGKNEICFSQYNAFTDTYLTTVKPIDRPWNWAALISPNSVYFILGNTFRQPPSMSPTNTSRTEVVLKNNEIKNCEINGYNFINGAQELQFNSTAFDKNGKTTQGHFSSYRTTWKDDIGYLLRSTWQNEYFSLKNFYKTSGTIMNPFASLTKLLDVPGGGLKEGQLTSLSSGIYLFSNIGAAIAYKSNTGTWNVVGGGNPGLFRTLQDNNIVGHDDETNSLLIASDGDRQAYLSFDYSNKAFIKFNEADFTFSTLCQRPIGTQWLMSIY